MNCALARAASNLPDSRRKLAFAFFCRGSSDPIMMLCRLFALIALGLPVPAAALTLDFPAPARLTAEETRQGVRTDLPKGPWREGGVARVAAEGDVARRAWRLDGQSLTTLQILAPLRAQLRAEGYETVFQCQDRGCGGFDFRFATDTLPEPAMHVDLGDYHYLLAEGAEGEWVSLMVSRAPGAGYVQLTRVTPAGHDSPAVVASTKAPSPATLASGGDPLLDRLTETGAAPLNDLLFETGSAELGDGPFPSLTALAEFLKAEPDSEVVLVGHTDSEGGLADNIALSERRAESVAARLRGMGVAAAQISAEGVGYLAPRASNATQDGRLANRRVEVVLAR